MNKKITAALSIAILSAAGFGYVAENNFSAVAPVKVEAAQITDSKFSIGGVSLGMSLGEVKNILGEPARQLDDDKFIFSNGLIIEIKKLDNTVEEIKIYQSGVATGAGVSVGTSEKDLISIYGTPDSVEKDDGETEYKYYSSDKSCKIKFELKNAFVSRIKSSMHD